MTALKVTGLPILDTRPSIVGFPNILKPRIQVDLALISLDTTPPVVIPPPNQVAEATGPSGAIVNYPPPTATDNVGVTVGPSCSPLSGSTFPIGVTTVNCTAEDAAGNVGTASFTVTVQAVSNTSPVAFNDTYTILHEIT